jgi:exosortase
MVREARHAFPRLLPIRLRPRASRFAGLWKVSAYGSRISVSWSSLRRDAMTRLSPSRCFAFLCALSLLIGWHSLFSAFALAMRSDEYTHLLLIVPISACLILFDWAMLKPAFEPAVRLGSALLVIAILIGAYSRWMVGPQSDSQLSVSMLAMVIWWIGSFVLSFGVRAARQLLFPLVFLFWLVPIPAAALDKIVASWQQGSAISASWLFSAVGVPVTQNGIVLSIPGLTLEVAQECSSVRSSLMLIVTSVVLAHLFLASFWRKTAVVLAAIPLSIFKNGVRIFTISMLGTRVDPGFLHGNLHRHGGILFFLLALFAMLVLLWLLSRNEKQVSENYSHRQKPTGVGQHVI